MEQVKAKITEIDDMTKTTVVHVKEMETKIAQLTAEKEASMGGETNSLSDKVDALYQNHERKRLY